ncbi:MAG: hypothetical protein ACJA1F_002921, partial [Paracoccaceae bacterium]
MTNIPFGTNAFNAGSFRTSTRRGAFRSTTAATVLAMYVMSSGAGMAAATDINALAPGTFDVNAGNSDVTVIADITATTTDIDMFFGTLNIIDPAGFELTVRDLTNEAASNLNLADNNSLVVQGTLITDGTSTITAVSSAGSAPVAISAGVLTVSGASILNMTNGTLGVAGDF